MNIELEEVVGLDVSDDALELAAGGAQGGLEADLNHNCTFRKIAGFADCF